MKKRKKDPIREDRIDNQAIVDAYGPQERAMGWYYYLENQLQFPFQARCITANIVSPLSKGETVQVLRMAPEEACSTDMLVCSCSSAGKAGSWRCLCPNWPRSTRINQPPKPSSIGIIGSRRDTFSDLRTPAENSQCVHQPPRFSSRRFMPSLRTHKNRK